MASASTPQSYPSPTSPAMALRMEIISYLHHLLGFSGPRRPQSLMTVGTAEASKVKDYSIHLNGITSNITEESMIDQVHAWRDEEDSNLAKIGHAYLQEWRAMSNDVHKAVGEIAAVMSKELSEEAAGMEDPEQLMEAVDVEVELGRLAKKAKTEH